MPMCIYRSVHPTFASSAAWEQVEKQWILEAGYGWLYFMTPCLFSASCLQVPYVHHRHVSSMWPPTLSQCGGFRKTRGTRPGGPGNSCRHRRGTHSPSRRGSAAARAPLRARPCSGAGAAAASCSSSRWRSPARRVC